MIHVFRFGQTYGPYSDEVARAYVETGHIRPDDFIWSEEQPGWTVAQDHPFLKNRQLPPPPFQSLPPPSLVSIDKSTHDETLDTRSKMSYVTFLDSIADLFGHGDIPSQPFAPAHIPPQPHSSLPEGTTRNTRRPVGGWLLFPCICLTILNPLGVIVTLNSLWLPLVNGPALYSFYIGTIGVWYFITGLNLWKREFKAVSNARFFMISMSFYPILGLVVVSFDGMSDSLRSTLNMVMADAILPQLFWSTLWYQYLTHSKRVHETFLEKEYL